MTFQAGKMKFLNSMTFQVFHDAYEPCIIKSFQPIKPPRSLPVLKSSYVKYYTIFLAVMNSVRSRGEICSYTFKL